MSRRPAQEPPAEPDGEPPQEDGAPGVLRFGIFELDATAGELRRQGVRVSLQAQPAKLLALLARHAGTVVSREQIRAHLWGDTLVDYEQGIHFAVRQIRRALRDRASAPRFVETVPGCGYRFLAEVESSGGEGSPAGGRPVRRRPAPWWLALLAALTIFAAWGGWRALRSEAEREPERPSVLVLSFVTPGAAETDAWLGEALTEELIGSLTRRWGNTLDVIALETVHRLEDAGLVPADVTPDFVVEGTVRKTSVGLRVTVRLARTADAAQLWANDYQPAGRRELPELLAEIGGRIAEALGLQLAAGKEPRLHRGWRPEARRFYQQARDLLDRWLFSELPERPARLEQARRLLDRSLELDPAFAPALVEMARFHLWGEGLLQGGETGRRLLEQALDLDQHLESAHVEMAALRMFLDVDLDGAGRELERALALDPGFARAHHLRACYLTALGRAEEALAAGQRAVALNPLSHQVLADIAWDRLMDRHPEEAIVLARRALELSDNRRAALRVLMLAREQQGDFAGAVSEARRWLEDEGPPAAVLARLDGLAPRRALAALYRWYLTEMSPDGDLVARAAMHTALGESDAALDLLSRAIRDPSEPARLFLRVDPRFDPLRGDPRFERLLTALFSASAEESEPAEP